MVKLAVQEYELWCQHGKFMHQQPPRHQASTLSSIGDVQSPHRNIENLKVLQDRPLLVWSYFTPTYNMVFRGPTLLSDREFF